MTRGRRAEIAYTTRKRHGSKDPHYKNAGMGDQARARDESYIDSAKVSCLTAMSRTFLQGHVAQDLAVFENGFKRVDTEPGVIGIGSVVVDLNGGELLAYVNRD